MSTDETIQPSTAGTFLREQTARYRRRISDGVQLLAFDLAVTNAAAMVDGHSYLNDEMVARWEAGEPRDWGKWHLVDDEVFRLLDLFHYWSFMQLGEDDPDPCDDTAEEVTSP